MIHLVLCVPNFSSCVKKYGMGKGEGRKVNGREVGRGMKESKWNEVEGGELPRTLFFAHATRCSKCTDSPM